MNFMQIKKYIINGSGIRFSVVGDGKEAGRAYLYILQNDLHKRPFALLEDLFIKESWRGRGLGTKLIKDIIQEAQDRNCYKLIATSRYARSKVHQLYKKLGFEDWGKEFRIDL